MIGIAALLLSAFGDGALAVQTCQPRAIADFHQLTATESGSIDFGSAVLLAQVSQARTQNRARGDRGESRSLTRTSGEDGPGKTEMHYGVDGAAPPGSPVRAAADATAVEVNQSPCGAGDLPPKGNRQSSAGSVTIEFVDQRAIYAHVNPGVKVGDTVRAGQALAATTGRDLHFGMQVKVDGEWTFVDPLKVDPVRARIGAGQARADGQAEREGVTGEVTRAAREFLDAVKRRDLDAILSMVSANGLRCHDDYATRKDLGADLRKPGACYHGLFFDTEALRKFSHSVPPGVSLLELVEAGGEMTLKVLFWDDSRGPLFAPCVYVHAAKFSHAPQLCFHEEKGRWRLWKSPAPGCS